MRFPKRTTLTHLIIAVYIRNWISKPFKDIFVIKKKKKKKRLLQKMTVANLK